MAASTTPSFSVDLGSVPKEDRVIDFAYNVSLSLNQNSEEVKIQLYTICYQLVYRYMSGEKASDPTPAASFEVKLMSGGISNQMYSCKMDPYPFLIVRIFGLNSEQVIDRFSELDFLKYCSKQKIGIDLYGNFSNGRVEGFLLGWKCFLPHEMLNAEAAKKIAARMAWLHSLDYFAPTDRACQKEGTLTEGGRHPCLFDVLDSFATQALRLLKGELPVRYKNDSALLQKMDLLKMQREWTELKVVLEQLNDPVAFCHNDLLSGNIMQEEATGNITFIDHEYGASNFRSFDIANHWCECCGFNCEWENFPSKEQQSRFARAYLSALTAEKEAKSGGKSTKTSVSDEEVAMTVKRAQVFVLSAHLFWGFWAVVIGSTSINEFDYWSYAILRFQGYWMMKEDTLVLAKELTHTLSVASSFSFSSSSSSASASSSEFSSLGALAPASSSNLRVVVIGYGFAGRHLHCRLVTQCPSLLTLHGVVARSTNAKQAVIGDYGAGAVKFYDSVDAVCGDRDVDLCIIASPPATHCEIALQMLHAGKHVVVDKPFALTLDQCDKMIALAKTQGLFLACFQNRRFDGDYLTVQKLMHKENALGDVKWVEMSYQKGFSSKAWKLASFEAGGGRFLDLGTHMADQFLNLFPAKKVASVHCTMLSERKDCPGMDTHALMTIKLEDGTVGVLDTNCFTRVEKQRFYVVGEKGTFSKYGFDPQEGALISGKTVSSVTELVEDWGQLVTATSKLVVPTVNGRWVAFYEQVAACIQSGLMLPSPVPLEQTRTVLRVMEAALLSVKMEQVVKF